MIRITATEASRSFSDVLNRVAAGEEFEVVRNGAPVAVISGRRRKRFVSAEELREIVGRGTLDERYAEDVRAIRRASGPPVDPWAS